VVTALGGKPSFHHAALVPQARDALAAEHAERGRVPIVCIDEGHLLSHDALEVSRLADRVLRMEAGRLRGPAVELGGADPLALLEPGQVEALARAALAAGLTVEPGTP